MAPCVSYDYAIVLWAYVAVSVYNISIYGDAYSCKHKAETRVVDVRYAPALLAALARCRSAPRNRGYKPHELRQGFAAMPTPILTRVAVSPMCRNTANQ